MPRKHRAPKLKTALAPDPVMKHVLEVGDLPDPEVEGDRLAAFHVLGSARAFRAAWAQWGDEILSSWVEERPGTRPQDWWAVEGHRRKRLGGTGTPAHEHLAYAPEFSLGIPVRWVTDFDVAYYTGHARDIHGNRIGLEHDGATFRGVAISPADPPTFEGQAAFLRRRKLLTPDERARLTDEDFELEEVIHVAEDT